MLKQDHAHGFFVCFFSRESDVQHVATNNVFHTPGRHSNNLSIMEIEMEGRGGGEEKDRKLRNVEREEKKGKRKKERKGLNKKVYKHYE
jgi:hypothetical protein